jgi:hypothetical protein
MSLIFKNVVEEGLKRLPSQWDDSEVVQGLIRSYLEATQEVVDVAEQLNEEMNVYSAVGVQLDILGLIVGEPRDGRNDDDYRDALLLRSSVNISDATPDKILEIVELATQTTSPNNTIIEDFPAGVTVIADSGPNYSLQETIEASLAAGVKCNGVIDVNSNYGDDYLIMGHAFSSTDVQVFNNNSILTDSVDFDNGYIVNPLAYSIADTPPELSVSDFVFDDGDLWELDDGSTLALIT